MTSPAALRRLRELPTSHPDLYQKLTQNDKIPFTYRKPSKGKAKAKAKEPKKVAKKVKLSKKSKDVDTESDEGPEFDDRDYSDEEEEKGMYEDNGPDGDGSGEGAFTRDIINDSCDVPIDVIVEHIITEGQSEIDGLVVDERGNLARSTEAEKMDADTERPAEHLGRGKRTKTTSRWYGKDWEFHGDQKDEGN